MPLTNLKTWFNKTSTIAGLAGLVLISGVAGAVHMLLDWQVGASIRHNAEIKAVTWSDRFFQNVPNAEQMFVKGAVAPANLTHLVESFAMIDVVRFELFDEHGHRTFISDASRLEHDEPSSPKALEVFRTGQPHFNFLHDEEAEHLGDPDAFVEAYVPAVTPDGRRIGTIETYVDVSPLKSALEYAFQQISWVLILGTTLLLAIPAAAYVQRTRQLRRKDQRLLELTRYDQLTGVLNRNSISDLLKEKFKSPEDAAGLGVLFIDVDYFKQVNDQYGHACGDILLKHIAGILKASTRSKDDIVGRFGGDEFVILASGISIEDFRKLYGRVMEGAKTPCRHEDKSYVPSLSVGAYLTAPGDSEKLALHRADLAVYAAKRRGRGQVVEYSHVLEGLFKQDAAKQSA
ncbi:GGDEF domain-containing protein [Roseibium sp. M-1]